MTELYRFQKRGVAALRWFVGDRGAALLADDPGLGKTVQILEFVHRHLRRKTVVVVCPATVKTNWRREAATKYQLRAVVLSGTRPPKDAWRRMERGVLYVVNPDILGAWLPHLLRLHPSLVVADEAHLFKSRKAKRTKALRVLGWACKRRIAATGTPLPNYPSDLWAVANWLWPEEFPSFWSFASRYCKLERRPWGWEHRGADRLDELHTVLRSLGMIRRRKADVLDDLPPKVRRAVPLELSDRRQYEEARDDFRKWARKNMRKALSAAQRAEGMTKAGYLFRLTGTLKLPAVETWVQDWLDNTEEKLILFARHRAVLKPLYARFKDAAVLVDGSVTGRKRDDAIDRFNKSRRCRLFLGNVLAAGVGWSAKGCTNVAFCEYPDRPADLTQAEDRAYGMFRGKAGTSTTVWLLTARGTVEEARMDKLRAKQEFADAAIDGRAGEVGLDLLGLLSQLIEEEVRK